MEKRKVTLRSVAAAMRQIADYLAQVDEGNQEKKRAQWRRWQRNYRSKKAQKLA